MSIEPYSRAARHTVLCPPWGIALRLPESETRRLSYHLRLSGPNGEHVGRAYLYHLREYVASTVYLLVEVLTLLSTLPIVLFTSSPPYSTSQ